jgi:hypothetical protein
MAHDRFIHFKGPTRPTREDLGVALEDYLRGVATEVRWDRDRYFITLAGSGSSPFERLGERRFAAWREPGYEGRFFEVWWREGVVDVITRQQDPLTEIVADGFATLAARFWKGERED